MSIEDITQLKESAKDLEVAIKEFEQALGISEPVDALNREIKAQSLIPECFSSEVHSEYLTGVFRSGYELLDASKAVYQRKTDYENEKYKKDCEHDDQERRNWKSFRAKLVRTIIAVVVAVLLYSLAVFASENFWQLENGKGFIRVPIADWFAPSVN